MDLNEMLKAVTPEVYENLKYAVETGKWQNGRGVTEEQRANALQLVLAYQAKVEQSNQHFTVGADGELVVKSKSELKRDFRQGQEIARFEQNDPE